MCVIVFKNAGVEVPTSDIFQDCWDSNPDGFGMAVAYGDRVVLDKGYMTYAAAYDAARMIPKECAAILHFRIGTSGKNDAPTCHPYPVSNNYDALRTKHFDSLPYAVAHNGIISSKGDGELNDTQVWIRDKLSVLYRPEIVTSPVHPELVRMFLDEAAELYSSRFALLNADGSCFLAGTWHDHESGLKFSNNNWKWSYGYGRSTTKSWNWGTGSWSATTTKETGAKETRSYLTEKFEPKNSYDEYYEDLSYGIPPACPYCGSYDTIAHEGSQHDLCECYDCGAVYNGMTGDEYGVVFNYKDSLADTDKTAKAAYVEA